MGGLAGARPHLTHARAPRTEREKLEGDGGGTSTVTLLASEL